MANGSAAGPPATMAYLEGLRVPFDAVLSRPLAGRSEPDLGDAMRSVGFRSHRLYYRVEPSGILIVRILHHARDIDRVFGGER